MQLTWTADGDKEGGREAAEFHAAFDSHLTVKLPRYYHVGSEQCLSYMEACAHAANLSDYDRRPIVVTRDGNNDQGESSVACFLNGKMVFPFPR